MLRVLGCFIFMMTLTPIWTEASPSHNSPHYIDIKLPGDRILVNLRLTGVHADRNDEGKLTELQFDQSGIFYRVHFFDNSSSGFYRPSLVQRFQRFEAKLFLHGESLELNEDGELLSRSEWKKGTPHGVHEVFSPSGKLRELRQFDSGLPVKKWQLFYEDGVLANEIKFPETKEDWNRLFEEKKNQSSGGIFADIDPLKEVEATETWYNQNGKKQRTTSYSLSYDGGFVSAHQKGSSQVFDHFGRVIRDREMRGRRSERDSRYNPSLRGGTWEHRWWMEGRLFRTSKSSSPKFENNDFF